MYEPNLPPDPRAESENDPAEVAELLSAADPLPDPAEGIDGAGNEPAGPTGEPPA